MYLRAKHEWDERIGSALSSAHSWKLAAFIAIVVAGCAVVGISYIGSQSKIKPYAIALTDDNVLPMTAMQTLPDTELKRVYVSNIRRFIEDIRSIYVDVNAQKQAVTKAYAYLRQGDPAHSQITRMFKHETPFERAQTELVKVKVGTVLPLSDNTYQAEWTETLTSPKGEPLGVQRYKATLNTYITPPTSRAQMNVNPLGFFIKTFNDVQVN
ncbi:VirB8/TrbF family protein [Vibrio owensii]|uniref:VirB8/TrbF family protein n=1 Tax=Vibrio owensii TaxID=696485 RepID=UPI0038CEE6AD